MSTTIIKETPATRPTPSPLGSSILDHATVTENARFGLRNNEGLWPSYNQLDTFVPTALCPDPSVDMTKEFSFAEWVGANEFAVYGGIQCNALGLDKADMEAEVRRAFSLSEGKGVEAALTEHFALPATGTVDLTAAQATFNLTHALAVLTGYAAQRYIGQPTIHMPRSAAVVLFAAGALTETGGKFFTKTGAKVAAGGGYDNESYLTGGDGKWTMYVTGEVYVERSGQVDVNAYVIPGDGSGTGSDENGLRASTAVSLVERMYRFAVDGPIAKATGTVWS